MLTEDKIKKNYEKFVKTGQTYGFMPEALIEFLGEDILKAPATTTTSMFNAFEGGLIDFILRLTKKAIDLNENELLIPANLKVDKTSLIKVCLLHQIGKAKVFVPNSSDWHVKNHGKLYEYAPNTSPIRVSERSLQYMMKFGVELTEDEYIAILNYDKDVEDSQSKYYNNMLGKILKIASELLIMEIKNK